MIGTFLNWHVYLVKNIGLNINKWFKITQIKGGIVTDIFGTSILSNEFVVIGKASTENLGVRAKKWLKNQNLKGMI